MPSITFRSDSSANPDTEKGAQSVPPMTEVNQRPVSAPRSGVVDVSFVGACCRVGLTYSNVGFRRVLTFKHPLLNGVIWSSSVLGKMRGEVINQRAYSQGETSAGREDKVDDPPLGVPFGQKVYELPALQRRSADMVR